ncbi:polymeric immunoglobulin receptor-like isoform X2 [Uranotaenia lowii]|uniref:polymeric immunoglobulin receptor-like isoform X2 n=1 Tax=Uranotaenia lowii TaxID=190385 RepID=UPI002479CBB9|nr:polymeric immunoglobulin receptor-like isoform X2 [Uranotaenia lowii]
MTIKLHECKHKHHHHHKHHRDCGAAESSCISSANTSGTSDLSHRINFTSADTNNGDVVPVSVNDRGGLLPPSEVSSRIVLNWSRRAGKLPREQVAAAAASPAVVNTANSDDGKLVECCDPALPGLWNLEGRVTCPVRKNDTTDCSDSVGDDGGGSRSKLVDVTSSSVAGRSPVVAVSSRWPRQDHHQELGRRHSRNASCSQPCSFYDTFYRYRFLRSLAVLYIALVVVITNAVAAFEPDFVYPLENVTIAKGRDATFTCVVNNLGGYRVAWIKADAKAILAIHEHVITNNGRLSVTHNDYNTWTLVIRNVKMEDRGLYMCQVNTDPMKMQTAFLEVVIPPDIIYEETSGDMMVPEGGSAKLVCKARGYPKPKIIWRREDGREIIARNGTHGKMKATVVEGEMLSLTKVTRSEMGAYMCIASNGVPPSVSKRMKLQVHFHPLIQVPNQLVGAPLGTDVTLICNVEASPKAINYWQRENGEMIISNERYSMSENESSMYAVQMTLVIRKLHKADMGGYKCISKNSIGDAEGTIRLYEMELQKKTKTAHRLNSVEDTSVNDEINSTPNIDQGSEENNKIHKNGRLYKGLQSSEHDLMSSSGSRSVPFLCFGGHLDRNWPPSAHQSSPWTGILYGGVVKLLIVLLVHFRQTMAQVLLPLLQVGARCWRLRPRWRRIPIVGTIRTISSSTHQRRRMNGTEQNSNPVPPKSRPPTIAVESSL